MKAISAPQAKELVDSGKAQFVDIRETAEYKEMFIEGSLLTPLSVFSLLKFPKTEAFPVFFCRSGMRTQANLELLEKKTSPESYWMEGGINAWIDAGLPVKRQHASLPIMRQVHIVAGGLVLLSVGLTTLWHPAFWVACVVGAGLFFSGITGTCAMQSILSKMPWNKEI